MFFIVFEIGARLWFPLPKPYAAEPGLLVMDARGFWVLEPDFHGQYDNRVDFRGKKLTITEYGTRLVPCVSTGASARNRVFLIGDSQTFGVGLSDKETWANLLQCKLNDRDDGPWAVYNLSVPGINIDQYYARTARMLSNVIQPGDKVVVSVTWNDLHTEQATSSVRAIVKNSQYSEQSKNQQSGTDGMALMLKKPYRRDGEKTWRYWLYQRTGIFIPSFNSLGEFVNSVPYASALLGIAIPKARLLYYRFRDTGVLAKKIGPERISNNFKILSAISDQIKRRGSHLIVNLLPNRLFFDDFYYWSYSQGNRGFPEQDYMMYLAKPHCAQYGLECVTSFPALKTGKRDEHSFSFDGHYNESGASRVASFLYRHLTTKKPD